MKAPAYKSIVKASRKAARNANMHLSKGCEIFQQKQAARCPLLRRRLSLNTRSDSVRSLLHGSYMSINTICCTFLGINFRQILHN